MAKVFTHHYVDDLDDSRLDDDKIDVVEFSFRGTDYTLDLSTKNGHQFNKDMAKYIEAALCARERSAAAQAAVNGSLPKKSSNGRRRPSRSNNRKTSRKNTAETALTREQRKAMRDWANSNGHNVSSRGRLSAEIIDAFNEAHP